VISEACPEIARVQRSGHGSPEGFWNTLCREVANTPDYDNTITDGRKMGSNTGRSAEREYWDMDGPGA
jgi:hypothetical protein